MEAAEKRRLARAERERKRAIEEQERLEFAIKEEQRLRLEAEAKALEEQRQKDEETVAPFVVVLSGFMQEIELQKTLRDNYIRELNEERAKFEAERKIIREKRSAR